MFAVDENVGNARDTETFGALAFGEDGLGNVGILGEDYPGYYPFGEERSLAVMLSRVETDSAFLRLLQRHGRERKKRISALQEKRALAAILREI